MYDPVVAIPSAIMTGPVSPFIHTNARKAHTSQTDIAPASASSTSSSSTAATLARLPTTTSCLDLLHQGIAAAAASTGSSSKADSSPSPPQQPKDTSSHGSSSLAATAAVNAAHAALAAAAAAAAATETKSSEINSGTGSSSGSLLRTGSSAAGWAFRAAEARAAALSGIRTMPDRPLALLYQMVGLMKVIRLGYQSNICQAWLCDIALVVSVLNSTAVALDLDEYCDLYSIEQPGHCLVLSQASRWPFCVLGNCYARCNMCKLLGKA